MSCKINNYFERLYINLLSVIFGGIVLHAPLTVWLGSNFPDYSLFIKSWKEILMLIASFIAIYLLYKNKKFNILKTPLILTIAVYALLHFVLLFIDNQGLMPSLAGLIIDLRYLFFFVLVYVALQLFPEKKDLFLRVGIIGALIVAVFAILQVFVLPKDFLIYLGYGENTIQPYLTVDQNQDFIRINSTLRGPNPLGAYAVIVLSILFSALLKKKTKINKSVKQFVILSLLIIGSLVALWFSYSRSAMAGSLVSLAIVFITILFKKLSVKNWLIIGLVFVIIGTGLFAIRNTDFISHIVLHENPSEGNNVNSNEGHINSLTYSLDEVMSNPLGTGVGSTGSASLLSDKTKIVENQYLMIAHESGWLGLAYFLSIYGLVLWQLWDKRKDWYVLGVFSSGIGLAVIGLFLPVFADDTVSIIWWGLAGIIVGSSWHMVNSRKQRTIIRE